MLNIITSYIDSRKIAARKKQKQIKFQKDVDEFNKGGAQYGIRVEELMPCLDDNTEYTGFDAHYIYHPAWAARKIRQISPKLHIDISSTLHFCTLLSAFIPVEFYDYRPAILNLDCLDSKRADLMKLPFETNSIESISCMHTVEHIGLGRYGDPIDPIGDIKAMNELKRVCAIGGNLILVVPVGRAKIMFNAHRIYDPENIMNLFEGFELIDFSAILDDNNFVQAPSFELIKQQTYGCGCFWFKKL
jgi:SAM-dependent methyltransferase